MLVVNDNIRQFRWEECVSFQTFYYIICLHNSEIQFILNFFTNNQGEVVVARDLFRKDMVIIPLEKSMLGGTNDLIGS